jgi:hypothetical protein
MVGLTGAHAAATSENRAGADERGTFAPLRASSQQPSLEIFTNPGIPSNLAI